MAIAGDMAIVEIACETDFVAKNADFIASGTKIAQKAFDAKANAGNEELEGMLIVSSSASSCSLREVEAWRLDVFIASISACFFAKTATVLVL